MSITDLSVDRALNLLKSGDNAQNPAGGHSECYRDVTPVDNRLLPYNRIVPLTYMRLWLFLLSSCGLSIFATGQSQQCVPTAPWKKAPPRAEVEISLPKKTFHACDKSRPRECEWAKATFRITNCGSFPFYIPKSIDNLEWHGGFEDIVSGPFDLQGALHTGGAADYGPDYHPDVLKEIQESWILLMPGEFYGGTLYLHTAPLSPGIYKVVGRRCPPRLSDELRVQLDSVLKFPVLLENVDSQPVYLKVVK